MKRLLLLLSLLVATPAMADLGPADILLPGETYVDWYTARKAKRIEAYCAKWKNKCMVEITSDHLVVDDEYRVHRSNLIHAWSNQLHGPGSGIRDFVHVVYKRDDGTNGTAQFIFTNMTSAAEFYNRLQLLMRLGSVHWRSNSSSRHPI